jgi:hypothetical protein
MPQSPACCLRCLVLGVVLLNDGRLRPERRGPGVQKPRPVAQQTRSGASPAPGLRFAPASKTRADAFPPPPPPRPQPRWEGPSGSTWEAPAYTAAPAAARTPPTRTRSSARQVHRLSYLVGCTSHLPLFPQPLSGPRPATPTTQHPTNQTPQPPNPGVPGPPRPRVPVLERRQLCRGAEGGPAAHHGCAGV